MTFDVDDEAGEEGESLLETLGITGPALVVRSGGGIAGQPFQPTTGARTLIGRSPECDIFLDDVTVSRRHAEIAREDDVFTIRDLGPERHLRQSEAHRVDGAHRRRRGADRQVPADLPSAMSTVTTRRQERGDAEPGLRTIGVVCEELRDEFPDISVSKIRYLEDQGLIAPQRTRGGYRLFSPNDIERLSTILRLQRDEFLPLRVIREALDGPARQPIGRDGVASASEREDEIDGAELCERVGHSGVRSRARGVRSGPIAGRWGRAPVSGESEADIAAACARLARFGIDARHLRTFLTATGRQATLVEQLVAPGLRSRNPERRKTALDDLELLARVAQELSALSARPARSGGASG